jgi:hypothetical protein
VNGAGFSLVGVNPGNPEEEVLGCGFFPHGVVGGMLAGLIDSDFDRE